MSVYHLLVAKVGLPFTLGLLLYLGFVVYLVLDIAVGVVQHLYWRLVVQRRLKALRKTLPFVPRQKDETR